MTAKELAESNLERCLSKNPYPGRGLVIGRSDQDTWLIVYWIMGRSTNSRNRRFVVDGNILRTEPVDRSQVKNPDLIIYEAMLELPGIFLASNGDQTRTVYEALVTGGDFATALAGREREPDAPNYTPRISGMVSFKGNENQITLSILKANPIDPAQTDRYFYHPVLPLPGFGFGLTTYSGDGDPLPSFTGDPLLLPLHGKGQEVLDRYWSTLDTENRVAMAVKEITDLGRQSTIFVQNRF